MNTCLSRRHFLKSAAGLTALALSACQRNPGISYDNPDIQNKSQNFAECPNQDSLSEQDIIIRTNLRYVDKSSLTNRTCANCKLYTLAQPASSLCGGCKVVPGPIHPKGYCVSWYPRM